MLTVAIIWLICSALLCIIPLTNVLGYESAAIMGVACSFGVVLYQFWERRKHPVSPVDDPKDGNIVVFGCLVMLISTPVLSIGWWLISLVSNRYEPKLLIDAVGNVKSK